MPKYVHKKPKFETKAHLFIRFRDDWWAGEVFKSNVATPTIARLRRKDEIMYFYGHEVFRDVFPFEMFGFHYEMGEIELKLEHNGYVKIIDERKFEFNGQWQRMNLDESIQFSY